MLHFFFVGILVLKLLRRHQEPLTCESVHWLKNFFTIFIAKYCALIDKEGGLQLLEELINGNVRPAPYQKVLELANLVRNNVGVWKKEHETSLLSSEDVMNEDDQALDLDG